MPCSVKSNESTMVFGYFNAHVRNDSDVWKGVIGQHVDANLNDIAKLLP